MDIIIKRVTNVEPSFVSDVNNLLAELKKDFTPETFESLQRTVGDSHAVAIFAMAGEKVVGMAYLFILKTLQKTKGFVEDVVVDGSMQGKGVGTRLIQAVIDEARNQGVRDLELTSRPSREAANKLYQKLGFEKRETNVYRLKLQ